MTPEQTTDAVTQALLGGGLWCGAKVRAKYTGRIEHTGVVIDKRLSDLTQTKTWECLVQFGTTIDERQWMFEWALELA